MSESRPPKPDPEPQDTKKPPTEIAIENSTDMMIRLLMVR